LVAFKRSLYIEGVGRNIDAGAWQDLPDKHRLSSGFGHDFLVCGGGRLITGRLWASKDGKGRSLYPMVVCVQSENIALAPSTLITFPLLTDLQKICQQEEQAIVVQSAVASMQRKLPTIWSDPQRQTLGLQQELTTPDYVEWLEQVSASGQGSGLQRFCHRLIRDCASFEGYSISRGEEPLPQQMRVPACSQSSEWSLLFWAALMRKGLSDQVPLILFRPFESDWVDILVGIPQAQQFACLLSGRDAIPLVTDIPYSLGEDSRDKCAQLSEIWCSEVESGMPGLWELPSNGKERSLSGLWERVQGLIR